MRLWFNVYRHIKFYDLRFTNDNVYRTEDREPRISRTKWRNENKQGEKKKKMWKDNDWLTWNAIKTNKNEWMTLHLAHVLCFFYKTNPGWCLAYYYLHFEWRKVCIIFLIYVDRLIIIIQTFDGYILFDDIDDDAADTIRL